MADDNPHTGYVPAAAHPDEEFRIAELHRLQILDTDPEPEFDEVVAVAAELCGVPMALVSLVDSDRQWFKSNFGLDASETGRDVSICAHAILTPHRPLVIPDLTKDGKFAGNPLVAEDPRLRFYAGWPLVTRNGAVLGTLCAIDTQPRELDERQLQVMQVLANNVARLLEARRDYRELQDLQDREARQRYRLLQAAAEASNTSVSEEQAVALVLDELVAILEVESAQYWSNRNRRIVATELWSGNQAATARHWFLDPEPTAPAVVAEAARVGRLIAIADEAGNEVLAVPVTVGHEVAGVISIHVGERADPTSRSLWDVLDQVGHQLGRAVERERTAQQLAWRANHDPITGLANRNLLITCLDEAAAQGRATSLAVAFIDLNRFKLINDSMGHAVGDELLSQVARRMESVTRAGDILARFGGDEFVLVCNGVTDPADVQRATMRLLESLNEPFDLGGQEVALGASAGISIGTEQSTSGNLLAEADAAMYRAKHKGIPIEMATGDNSVVETRKILDIEASLRRAVDESQIDAAYQPVYTVADGRIEYLEALARWERPGHGSVAPGVFIPVAEDSGLIERLDRSIRAKSLAQLREWDQTQGHMRGTRVAVNVSARELIPGLSQMMARDVAENSIEMDRLVVEITESTVVRAPEEAMAELQKLSDLGARIAIDDFGSGYSSLSRLRLVPAMYLKLAGQLLTGPDGETVDTAILEGVLLLSESLGMSLVVEGVEHPQQLLRLRELGVPYAQGYLLKRPTSAPDLAADPFVPQQRPHRDPAARP